jgi:hypothetical protein
MLPEKVIKKLSSLIDVFPRPEMDSPGTETF